MAEDKNEAMLTHEQARALAHEWVAAWNARDLERVLAHYTDDFEMSSPLIVRLMGEPSGTLTGKAAVSHYWRTAMAGNPDLHFDLLGVYTGANSITIAYRNQKGVPAAEVLFLGEDGRAYRAAAHYQEISMS